MNIDKTVKKIGVELLEGKIMGTVSIDDDRKGNGVVLTASDGRDVQILKFKDNYIKTVRKDWTCTCGGDITIDGRDCRCFKCGKEW